MKKSKILSVAVLALLLTTTSYTAGTGSTAAKKNAAAVKNTNTENIEFTEAYVKKLEKCHISGAGQWQICITDI